MISQISSLRAGSDNGCGSAQSDGQETAWLGKERTEITALHAAARRGDLGPVDQRLPVRHIPTLNGSQRAVINRPG
jgi:hypothetical protein